MMKNISFLSALMGVALQSTSIHAECVNSVGTEMVDGIEPGNVGVKIEFTTCDAEYGDWIAIYKVPDEDDTWEPRLSPEYNYKNADKDFLNNKVDFFQVGADGFEVYDLSYFAEGLHKVYLFDVKGAYSDGGWTYEPLADPAVFDVTQKQHVGLSAEKGDCSVEIEIERERTAANWDWVGIYKVPDGADEEWKPQEEDVGQFVDWKWNDEFVGPYEILISQVWEHGYEDNLPVENGSYKAVYYHGSAETAESIRGVSDEFDINKDGCN